MDLRISLDEFVMANTKKMVNAIECVFMTFGTQGLQGDLFKIKKTADQSLKDRLCLLLGRSACIGEEWNFKTFTAEEWQGIYQPEHSESLHILKTFDETPIAQFHHQFHTSLQFLKDKKERLTMTRPFVFNGENTTAIFNENHYLKSEEIEALQPLMDITFTTCYANLQHWHWQIWYLECAHYAYLYEETLVS